jgi:molybdenum cofactor cytidylyltransferase
MGSPKPLLAFEGKTFLEHLLDEFLASTAGPIVVVLGHGADRILKKEMEWRGARPVVNHNYRNGMLSSIRTGLEALAECSVEGVLVCPVDHPQVSRGVIDLLIRRFAEARPPIALPIHRGRRGHPVVFAREVFDEIKTAPDSVGARHVVWNHAEDVLEVETTDPGVTCDVDTPAEYSMLVNRS